MHAFAIMFSQLEPSKPNICFSSGEKLCSKKPRRLSLQTHQHAHIIGILNQAFPLQQTPFVQVFCRS